MGKKFTDIYNHFVEFDYEPFEGDQICLSIKTNVPQENRSIAGACGIFNCVYSHEISIEGKTHEEIGIDHGYCIGTYITKETQDSDADKDSCVEDVLDALNKSLSKTRFYKIEFLGCIPAEVQEND